MTQYALIDPRGRRTRHASADAAITMARRCITASSGYWTRAHNQLIAGGTVSVVVGTQHLTICPCKDPEPCANS